MIVLGQFSDGRNKTWASQRRAGPWLTPVRWVVGSLTCTLFLRNTNTQGWHTWHRDVSRVHATCTLRPHEVGDLLLTSYPLLSSLILRFWSSTSLPSALLLSITLISPLSQTPSYFIAPPPFPFHSLTTSSLMKTPFMPPTCIYSTNSNEFYNIMPLHSLKFITMCAPYIHVSFINMTVFIWFFIEGGDFFFVGFYIRGMIFWYGVPWRLSFTI